MVAAICVASSRVGASTRPRGRPGCGPRERAGQACDEGERERDRLAAAGAAAAEHVVTGERVGQRVALDGEGLGLAVAARTLARGAGTPRSRK